VRVRLPGGLSYKWGLVKVYAVGLYASGADGVGGDNLWQGLLDLPQRKAIVIKMARCVIAWAQIKGRIAHPSSVS